MGGIPENLIRILPKGLGAVVEKSKIQVLPIFNMIEKLGNIETEEMFRTFNMGIGLIIVTSLQQCDSVLKCLHIKGEKPIVIGRVTAQEERVVIK